MNDAALNNLYNELPMSDLNGIEPIQANESNQLNSNGGLAGHESGDDEIIGRRLKENIKRATDELKKIVEQKRLLEARENSVKISLQKYEFEMHSLIVRLENNDEDLGDDSNSNSISDENRCLNSVVAHASTSDIDPSPSTFFQSVNIPGKSCNTIVGTEECQNLLGSDTTNNISTNTISYKPSRTIATKSIKIGHRPQRGKQMKNMMSFKSLPFVYDCFADELLKPQTCSLQINTIRFEMTKEQITYLKDSHRSGPYRVLLRCCPIAHRKSSYNDKIPKALIIRINGWLMKFENLKTKELKAPLDITSYCNRSEVPNEVVLEWPKSQWEAKIRNLGVAACFSRRLDIIQTSNILNGRDYLRDSNTTLKLVKKKLNHSSETSDMICSDSIKLPLTCPITNKLIDIPCIGIKCQHLQCFDGQSFLEITKSKNEWNCPFCKKQIGWNELRVEGLMKDILKKTEGTCMQIEFDSNCDWKPVVGIKAHGSTDTAITLDTLDPVAVITIDDTDDDTEKCDSSEETDCSDSDTEENDGDDEENEENDDDESDEQDSDFQENDGKSKGRSKSSYQLRNRSADGKVVRSSKRKRSK